MHSRRLLAVAALALTTGPARHTTVGRLLAGHVFSWQNLVACGVGVIAGIGLDRLILQTPPACPPISPR